MRIRSPDLRIYTNESNLSSSICPRELQKKVIKNRSITPRSLLAKNGRYPAFSLDVIWVGRVLKAAKAGSTLHFQHCRVPGSVFTSEFFLRENHK